MWDAQAADLLPHFRVLRYDTRGHGASSATPGDYSIAELGQDVLAIADACGVERFAFCGLSLGGMIGQWLAAHAPERLTHLVLANTTSRLSDPQPMEARRRAVLERRHVRGRGPRDGPVLFAGGSRIVVTAGGNGAEDAAVHQSCWLRRLLCGDPGHGSDGAARPDPRSDARHQRRSRRRDAVGCVTRPYWRSAIAGARAVRLPAAHISNLERPRSFSAALLDFLVPVPPTPGRPASRSGARCSATPGSTARSAGTTDFTRDFQELITIIRLGNDLDAPRARPPHAPPARADGDGRARTMGGIPPARSHRPRARARTVRPARRSCCSWPCMPAFRRQTPRSTSPQKCSTRAPTDIPEPRRRTASSLIYDCGSAFDRRN